MLLDFQQFYGLDLGDVWTGDLGVRRALLLVGGLLDIDQSRYRAALMGGPQFQNFGDDRALAASTHDILLSIGAGLSGEKLTIADLWPRPEREVAPEMVGTIADFDVAAFMRQLGS